MIQSNIFAPKNWAQILKLGSKIWGPFFSISANSIRTGARAPMQRDSLQFQKMVRCALKWFSGSKALSESRNEALGTFLKN